MRVLCESARFFFQVQYVTAAALSPRVKMLHLTPSISIEL